MIATKPHLGNILKLTILCNFLGIDMAMVIYNWHCLCILMK